MRPSTPMSESEEKNHGPRWSQLESIIRGISTIFRAHPESQEPFGLINLYRARSTHIQHQDDGTVIPIKVKLAKFIEYLKSQGFDHRDSHTFTIILREIDNNHMAIVQYEDWRLSLPENERDSYIQFDRDGLDRLIANVTSSMTQEAPPTRRSDAWKPNKLPEFMETLSVDTLLRICRDRNLVVSPVDENNRIELMRIIADNVEFEY